MKNHVSLAAILLGGFLMLLGADAHNEIPGLIGIPGFLVMVTGYLTYSD